MKPGIFSNEELAELPIAARYLFIGLWAIADRAGRLEDRPRRIQAAIFPYDHDVNIEELLASLEAGGFIESYVVGEQKLIWLPTFRHHQNPHPHEPESVLPPSPRDPESQPLSDHVITSHDKTLHAVARNVMSGGSNSNSNSGSGNSVAVEDAPADAGAPSQPKLKLTEEFASKMAVEYPFLDMAWQVAEFRDYMKAEHKRYSDEQAAFRNSLRRAESRRVERVERTKSSGGFANTNQNTNGVADGVSGLDRRRAAIARLGRGS